MPDKHWIGAAGGAWGTNANWSLTQNGPANTVAPVAGETVYLDKTSVTGVFGINVNVSIPTPLTITTLGSSPGARWYLGSGTVGTAGTTTWTINNNVTIYVEDTSTARADVGIEVPMSGTGSIIKTGGGGGLLFSVGSRTGWSGGVTVQNGIIGATVAGAIGTGTLTFDNNGTSDLGLYNGGSASTTLANNIVVNGYNLMSWRLNEGSGASQPLVLSGTVTLTNVPNVYTNTVAGSGTTISGVLAGTGGFRKYGAGTNLTLSNANTITGLVTCVETGINCTHTNALQNAIWDSDGGGTTTFVNNSVIGAITGGTSFAFPGTQLTIGGPSSNASAGWAGVFTNNINIIKDGDGTQTLSPVGNISSARTSATTTVTKGTLICGPNSYGLYTNTGSGAVSVSSGGALRIDGSTDEFATRSLAVSGTGVSATGALIINTASSISFLNITLGGISYIRGADSGTIPSPINLGGFFLQLGAASGKTFTLSGVISNSVGGNGISVGNYSSDTGVVLLTGTNTLPATSVANLRGYGTMRLGNASALGSATLVFGSLVSGTLTTIDASTPLTITNTITLSTTPGQDGNILFGGTAALTFSGDVLALGASRTITTNGSGGALTITRQISGAGFSITKAGTNTLVLTNSNTYSGGTTLSGGTLKAGSLTALGTGTVTTAANTTLQTLTAGGQNGKLVISSGDLNNSAGATLRIGG